jgi:GR25 family glycosyltransferase involved in LPS biosynthesis
MENKINNKIPIYWINLERSIDRKNNFENQLEKYNIANHRRINGIDGKNIDLRNYNIIDNLTKYELGCTLSHLKAIKEAYDNNEKYVLVMEDDCNFEYIEHQKYSIDELIQMMNKDYPDWDILQLATIDFPDKNIELSKENNYISKGFRYSTACYLINTDGINKLVNLNGIYREADYYLYNNVNTYHLTKPYFIYNYSKTFPSFIRNVGKGSKKSTYELEDENKKFWDDYYLQNFLK